MIELVPISVLARLRKLTREQARELLEPYELDSDNLNRYLDLADGNSTAQTTVKRSDSYNPARRTWLAAAFILGASTRQLASLHKVSPQTILQSIDRVLPKSVRMSLRMKSTMSLEALSAYHAKYSEFAESLKYQTPLEVADWLNENTEMDV